MNPLLLRTTLAVFSIAAATGCTNVVQTRGTSGAGPAASNDGGTQGALPPPATDGGAIPTAGGRIVPLFGGATAITIAADAHGTIHAAIAAPVNGTPSVLYAHCAGGCDDPKAWNGTALAPSDALLPPTIALTADGRPRIAFEQVEGDAPGSYYAECNASCDDAASWTALLVAKGATPAPAAPPRLPFAISPSGAALFADNGGRVEYCAGSCASPSAWKEMLLGDYFTTGMLAFGPGEAPQLVTVHAERDTQTLIWLSCTSGDCSNPQSWIGVNGLWTTQNDGALHATLGTTSQGAPRILVYGAGATGQNVLGYLACDANCQNPTGWRSVLPSLDGKGDDGITLVADANNEPVATYVSDFALGAARCANGCASPSDWRSAVALTPEPIDQALNPLLPPDCVGGGWQFDRGGDVALVGGKPVIAFAASAHGTGVDRCRNGAYLGSAVFLVLPE